ncbi:MAG: glycosyltransferase [Gammaproteobacteria bacterium]
MKPKVLVIIDSKKLGGPGRGLLQIAERASDYSFDFSLVNFQYSTGSTEFIDSASQRGIPLHLLKQRKSIDPSPIWQTVKLIRCRGFNIIQSHGYKGHVIALIASRLCGVPWISVSHGWTNEDRKIKIYNAIERWLLRWADASIAVSKALYAEIKAIRGDHRLTLLISNSVDLHQLKQNSCGHNVRQTLGMPPDTTLLGVFGRLSQEKGQDLMLKALSQNDLGFNGVHVLFVGSGPWNKYLQEMAAQLNLSKRVHFVGHQPGMMDYYSAIDLLVLPSRSEGMPNVILEACAIGKPILATNVGDVSEVIEHGINGWLYSPESVESLIDALIDVLEQKERWSEIGAVASRSIFPKFSPTCRVSRFFDLYNEILKNA